MTDKYLEIKEIRLKIEKLEKHKPTRFLTLIGVIMSVIFVFAIISIIIHKNYLDFLWLLFFVPGPFLIFLNNRNIRLNREKIKKLEDELQKIEESL